MESREKTKPNDAVIQLDRRITSRISVLLVALLITIPVWAETYRWTDKDGKVHFGSSVPAEYADLPYDVISKSGLVLRRVEPLKQPPEVMEAARKKEEKKNKDSRQEQSDRLLLIQYQSEAEIHKARQLELDQVGYNSRLIKQSYANTNAAIIDKVRLAADQQRAGMEVSDAQTAEFKRLYRALEIDKNKLSAMGSREDQVNAQFAAVLLRYQKLVEKYGGNGSGNASDSPEASAPDADDKDQS